MLYSISDLAKYPFTNEAISYIKSLDLQIDELANSDYVEVLNRAEQRIEEALLNRRVQWRARFVRNSEIELVSYPVAIFFIAAIGDSFLDRRYALAEANKIYELLKTEDPSKLLEIVHSSFKWQVELVDELEEQPYDFKLSFIDYLQNASFFQDDRWKLVNRLITNGHVFLKMPEFARLISKEAEKRIFNTIQSSPKIPSKIIPLPRINRINQLLTERKRRFRVEELPKKTLEAAYPPCIKQLNDSILARHHLSHMGRFTLTSFLLNVGVTTEELVKVYISVSDFDEQQTRYQVEHIAGKRGAGTKYTPPNCRTLKTHGLCPGPDELCNRITNPLRYYRLKIREMRKRNEFTKDS